MAKSKSSKRWLKEHFDDEYVKKSQQDGYRSRAVYKLKEIQEKDYVIKPGMKVIDLGAAPGGWSQLAAEWVGQHGRVVASDILPIDPLAHVEFIQGDFRENDVYEKIMNTINKDNKDGDSEKFDVVISDMAPNFSGVESSDQPKAMYLCELALDMAKDVLKPNGAFIVKLFQGEGSDQYIQDIKKQFAKVKVRKPKASRPRSREVYVLAQHYL